MSIQTGQTILAADVLNAIRISTAPTDETEIDLTTAYQTLVAAPASGTRVVEQICLMNNDASVTAAFTVKIVRSSVDYVIFEKRLGPGESVMLVDLKLNLQSTDSIMVKAGASLTTGRVVASYHAGPGGLALLTFTGTAFSTALTVPTGKKYSITSILIQNTWPATSTLAYLVLDASSNVRRYQKKILGPSSCWGLDLKAVLSAGHYFQIKHGAASYTGNIAISYLEV